MFHGLFFAKTQVEFGALSSRFFFEFQALFLSLFALKMGRDGRERKSVGLLPFRIFIVPLHRNLARGAT